MNRGGLELKVSGVDAFMPASQVALHHVEDLLSYAGQMLVCEVIEINHEKKRVEMHLLSLEEQTVTIPEAGPTVTLGRDETIWTESSHKFTVENVAEMADRARFRCDNQWVDEEWPFAQSLLVAV